MSFPSHFYVYKAPDGSPQPTTTTIYYLGALDVPPFLICKETVSPSGHIEITMHSTPSTGAGGIVCSANGEGYGYSCEISCIPMSEQDFGRDQRLSGDLFRRLPRKRTWGFVTLISYADSQIAALFEWRHSRNTEVSSLRDGKRTAGDKLIRHQSGGIRNSVGRKKQRCPGQSSDGNEIVAVWTDDTQTSFRGTEEMAVGKFAFLGSAVASREHGLDEGWKRLAVISAMYQRRVRIQQRQDTSPRVSVPI